MAVTYTKNSAITDEATDTGSPGNETLFQGMARSNNYMSDCLLDGGGNSEKIPPTGLDYYESSWTSIADTASNAFAHGLGATPTMILVWASKHSAGFANAAADVIMPSGIATDRLEFVADATNVTVENNLTATRYIKVIAW